MYQVAATPDMFCPWHHVTSEDHVGPGLEALQVALLNQLIAEPAKSKSGLVVAEVWPGDLPKPYIGIHEPSLLPRSRLKLTALQMTRESRFASVNNAGGRTLVRTSSVARDPVCHQGQFNELLDLAASELGPYPFVFSSRFLFCRMRRPLDAQMAEVVETDLDRMVAPIERRVQINAQTGDAAVRP